MRGRPLRIPATVTSAVYEYPTSAPSETKLFTDDHEHNQARTLSTTLRVKTNSNCGAYIIL